MAEKVLDDLFHDPLKDIYYAEKKTLMALPKMAKGAQSNELKAGFEKHRGQTEEHVERLTKGFEIFGKRAQADTATMLDATLANPKAMKAAE